MNNEQNKINVMYLIYMYKVYLSVRSAELMEAPSGSAELLSFDLEPLTHKTVALIGAKLSFTLINLFIRTLTATVGFALIQCIIVLYGLCHLSGDHSDAR